MLLNNSMKEFVQYTSLPDFFKIQLPFHIKYGVCVTASVAVALEPDNDTPHTLVTFHPHDSSPNT